MQQGLAPMQALLQKVSWCSGYSIAVLHSTGLMPDRSEKICGCLAALLMSCQGALCGVRNTLGPSRSDAAAVPAEDQVWDHRPEVIACHAPFDSVCLQLMRLNILTYLSVSLTHFH